MKAIATFLLASAVAVSVVAGQDDPLKAARDLYASAAYEEALSELTRVGQHATAASAARETDAYRAFCLVALGRTGEAEAIAEALMRKDPMAAVDLREASPRIEEIFASARKRVLPQALRDEYRTARALALQKAPEAEPRLRHLQGMLAEAQNIGVWDDTLADLRVLVDGFLELAQAAEGAGPSRTAPAAEQVDAPAFPAAAKMPRIYTAADSGVAGPVVLSQPAPHIPPTLLDLVRRLHRAGILDIIIDEQGVVADVIVRQSVNAAYDALVSDAARTWKYRPATKDGAPVRFLKTVTINAE